MRSDWRGLEQHQLGHRLEGVPLGVVDATPHVNPGIGYEAPVRRDRRWALRRARARSRTSSLSISSGVTCGGGTVINAAAHPAGQCAWLSLSTPGHFVHLLVLMCSFIFHGLLGRSPHPTCTAVPQRTDRRFGKPHGELPACSRRVSSSSLLFLGLAFMHSGGMQAPVDGPGDARAALDTNHNREFRRQYRAFRSGGSRGAKGEPGEPHKPAQGAIRSIRSQIFPHDPEAASIRARFNRYEAASIVDGIPVASGPRHDATIMRPDGDDGDDSHAVPTRSRIACLAFVALICGACCQLCVELLILRDRHMGNIISATEYLYCALLSSGTLLRKRRLPWACHAQLWLAGVAHSALTNAGLAAPSLPMAVVLVVKNGSLLANLFVGRLVGKRPSWRELVAAAIISTGLILGTRDSRGAGRAGGTVASAASSPNTVRVEDVGAPTPVAASYGIGVLCLSGALIARALSGILQERIFQTHGVAYTEVLFWRATLGAPVFLAANLPVGSHAGSGSTAWAHVLSSQTAGSLLLLNVVGDHICKMAVTRLIGEAGSLLATIVICVQRFVSCVFSAAFLAPHPPPPSLWLAIVFVAVGSLGSIPPRIHHMPHAAPPRK